jgi:serine/threonine-protein kinase RsbW
MEPVNYLCISAELNNLPKIRKFIQESARSKEIDADAISDIVLAVDEITTNIIVHGYNGAGGDIEFKMSTEAGWVIIQVSDRARPFDPTRLPPPDISLPLEERTPGGLGVYLAKNLMDELTYKRLPSGKNQLTLIKEINQQTIKEEK